jgi:membrane dipeptidase
MASLVAEFVSEPYRHWMGEQARADVDLRKQTGSDRAAFTAGRAAWVAAHPAPVVTVKEVADHIEHIRDVAGIDHVGIGSDFDGTGEETIAGLEDVSKFPVLFAELARRGWSDDDLRKLADQNLLRVMEKVEQVAAQLQKTTAPSTRTIQELDGGSHQ